MTLSIPDEARARILAGLARANHAFQQAYPGDREDRQPVHTVYGGADLFRADSARRLGDAALRSLREHAPDFATFGRALALPGHEDLPRRAAESARLARRLERANEAERRTIPGWLAHATYAKVVAKLEREPVEDLRIDFEDGFGHRSAEEEDATAVAAAREVARGMAAGSLPPFLGIRIKPFTEDLKERGLRTLDLFVTTLAAETGGRLPPNFVVMLPKVTLPEQVSALADAFEALESATALAEGSLRMEMMVETTQAVLDRDGRSPLRSFVSAGRGRMQATAFGTYDYTAACNITARYQDMGHAVCDFAHHVMKVALGGTGVWLSDGATHVMPIGPHRGEQLTPSQRRENRDVVHRGWRKAFGHTRHSLWKGLYQGWDLNPAQLPSRYAAVYSFFLESREEATERLRAFVHKAARATLTDDTFDDAATGQGLLNYFLRGLNCGALSEAEVLETGLTLEELRSRSFLRILEGRRRG